MTFRSFVQAAFSLIPMMMVLVGCQGGDSPVTATTDSPNPQSPIMTGGPSGAGMSHQMLGFWWVTIDPDTLEYEVVPSRHPAMHFNVRGFLEDGLPCSDCLRITDIEIVETDAKY